MKTILILTTKEKTMNMLKLGTVSPLKPLFNNATKNNINKVLQFPLYTLCVLQHGASWFKNRHSFGFYRTLISGQSTPSAGRRTAAGGLYGSSVIPVQHTPQGISQCCSSKVAVLVPLQLIPLLARFDMPNKTLCNPYGLPLVGQFLALKNCSSFAGGCHD